MTQEMNQETKRILSFDVGIKNLAYCLIEKKNDDFSILNWNVINLVEDCQKCTFIMKGGKQCEQVAKYKILHKDEELIFGDGYSMFACNKHKLKVIPSIIENKEEIKTDQIKSKKKKNNNKMDDENKKEKKCLLCDSPSVFILSSNNDFGWCETHYTKHGKQFEKKIQTKKLSMTNSNKQPLQELSEKLFGKLDQQKDFLTAEEILIENQPSFKNPTMKTMSSILYAYFVVRGKIDKNDSNIKLVRFVSPSNKLKIDKKTTSAVLENKNTSGEKSNVYKMTKTLGVKYCTAIINSDDKNKLSQYKKKDDMADSFLQGFQYLFSPVPEKYMLKLKNVDIPVPVIKNK